MVENMTNQEILEKAIQKAVDGGWDYAPIIDQVYDDAGRIDRSIIFNHDFAKALWGDEHLRPEERRLIAKGILKQVEDWQYHLQQLVIADDPIKYLKENM